MKILPSEPQTDSDFSLSRKRTASTVHCLYGTVCRRTDDGTSFGRKEGRHCRRPKIFENSPRARRNNTTHSRIQTFRTHTNKPKFFIASYLQSCHRYSSISRLSVATKSISYPRHPSFKAPIHIHNGKTIPSTYSRNS